MTTATLEATVQALASVLASKKALDATHYDETTRLAATAEALRRAGSVLTPKSRSATQILAAIAKLENLAGLSPETVQRVWLAMRALDVEPGNHIGGNMVSNPVVQALASVTSLVPTLDVSERVNGVIGDIADRGLDTLAARARIVNIKPFTIINVDGPLFTESAKGVSVDDILQSIDRLPSRQAAPGAVIQAGTPANGNIDYVLVDPTNTTTDDGDNLFKAYSPSRFVIPGIQPHPTPLVESAAMASVLPPIPTYKPNLPMSLATHGILSDVQMEAVIYAGQAHGRYLVSDPLDSSATPPRQGFLIGHGTGVGKGRAGAAIMRDNWNQGRRHAVWITENARLFDSCSRDWVAVGGRPSDLIRLSDFTPAQTVPGREGILFCTYALMRDETRRNQILQWIGLNSDDVILFDEAQNMRNALVYDGGAGFSNKPSLQGESGNLLQQAVPNARIVYQSATSASDIISLGYAIRLGLWGRGTAFPSPEAFFEQMEKGGINALELVARDLKALGLYFSSNLSFEGVAYERLEYRLTDEDRFVQDQLAEAWATLGMLMKRAMVSTGLYATGAGTAIGSRKAVTTHNKAGRRFRAVCTAQFGMARARFFQAVRSSFAAKPVIDAVKQDLIDGHAAVIQITNTYEANAERAIAEHDSSDFSTLEATPRDILITYINEQFPVQIYDVKYVAGKKVLTPRIDANGDPVLDPAAVADRNTMLAAVRQLSVPEGPLEQLFAAFGPEYIAEVTGRRRRLVPGLNGQRILEERTPAEVKEDIRAFQSDEKRILVFSAAGGAGADYHADRNMRNQRLRRHYVLQAGWRADVAIQGMGRSHRSNQAQPPVYILVSTDLWSDRRMISAISAGMQNLGAITRGQRHAATQDLFTQEDNLESELATRAWQLFLADLEAGKIVNLSLKSFEKETGIELPRTANGIVAKNLPPLRRFLNAMSGMTCDKQDAFGYAFTRHLDEVRLEAIRNGTLDRGIETIAPDNLIKLEDTVIYREPNTGAETRLLKMLRIDKLDPVDFSQALRHHQRSGDSRLVRSMLTNRVACLLFPNAASSTPDDDTVVVITPTGIRQRTRKEVVAEKWQLVSTPQARQLWEAEAALPPEDEEVTFHVVTGCLLPIWDKMPRASDGKRIIVYQMTTDQGERILGRVLPNDWPDKFVTRVSAAAGNSIDPDQALIAVETGEVATLANGWTAQGRRNLLNSEVIVEIYTHGEDPEPYRGELEKTGIEFRTATGYAGAKFNVFTRLLMPTDPTDRQIAWSALIQHRPVASLTALH